MMRAPDRIAIAVRWPDGTIARTERPFVSLTRRKKLLGLKVVRATGRKKRGGRMRPAEFYRFTERKPKIGEIL